MGRTSLSSVIKQIRALSEVWHDQKLFQSLRFNGQPSFSKKLELVSDENLVAFYGSELPAPNTPISEVEFVALDFETTGLNPEKHDIITIGLVPFNLRRIFLRDARHWKVRPQKSWMKIPLSSTVSLTAN